MTDDLVIICLVLILRKEVRCAGESDVVDVLLDFIRGHTDAVIRKRHRLLLGIYTDIDARFVAFRIFKFTHRIEFFQLRDCIAAVRYKLTDENVVVRIQPLLYDGEHILTVNG